MMPPNQCPSSSTPLQSSAASIGYGKPQVLNIEGLFADIAQVHKPLNALRALWPADNTLALTELLQQLPFLVC
jgi:hypothetical protein